jgi:hypothetical protein
MIYATKLLFCPRDGKLVPSRDCYKCRQWFDADDNTNDPTVVYCNFPEKSTEPFEQAQKVLESLGKLKNNG